MKFSYMMQQPRKRLHGYKNEIQIYVFYYSTILILLPGYYELFRLSNCFIRKMSNFAIYNQ